MKPYFLVLINKRLQEETIKVNKAFQLEEVGDSILEQYFLRLHNNDFVKQIEEKLAKSDPYHMG